MADENLKPCPFCGSEPEMLVNNDFSNRREDDPDESYYVRCPKCFIEKKPLFEDGYETREKANSAWNTRAQEPTGDAVEALPEVCDGKEQYAFEEWAKSNRMEMREHPIYFIFLDERTDAARKGWEAGIEYCRKAALQTPAAGNAIPAGYALVPIDCRKADLDTSAFDGYKGNLEDAYHNVQNYINWAIAAAPNKIVKG